jgi:hypothetical protein
VTTQGAEGDGDAGGANFTTGGPGGLAGAPALVMHPDDLPKDAPLSDVADAALTAAVVRAGRTAAAVRGPAASAPEQASAQGQLKLAQIAGPAKAERGREGAGALPPHDPITGEILPEQAKPLGGLDISVVAEPAPPVTQSEQTEDLAITESRQNFSRGHGHDDLGLGG